MGRFKQKYSKYFSLSIVLHGLLFFFLFTSVIFSSKLPYVIKQGQDQKIINAVTVNQTEVEAEVQRLQQQQAEQQRSATQRIQKLQQLASQARRERQAEQIRIQQLKAQQIAQERQAEKNLVELQKQKDLQQQQLAEIQKQNTAAKMKLAQQQEKVQALKKQQALAKLHKENDAKDLLQQQLLQEQQQLQAAKAQYINGIENKYYGLITNAIYNNWYVPPTANPNEKVQVQINLEKDGTVLSAAVIKSSGDVALDRSAITAIYKASPLPVPTDPTIFADFQEFTITMIPTEKSNAG